MRIQGKITHWNEEKGYGFVTPSNGAKRVFVHIRAFGNRGARPAVGKLVSFSLSTDKQGRPCAVRVTRAGEHLPGEIKRNDVLLWSLAAILFLALVGVAVAAGFLPFEVLLIYLSASLITFGFYAWDKSAARAGASRTPENTLHLLALAGGWPGALIAQQTLRHKSRKESFRAVFWVTVVLNCAVLGWLFTDAGAEMLRSVLHGLA